MEEFLRTLSIWIMPVLFAITLHEVAHGWAASKLGDSTALRMGRLSLNPIDHIDPIGTIILPLLMLAIGGFVFGWAKPVPVDWRNLHNPRRDTAIVAVAGPLANLLMAIGWMLIAKLGLWLSPAMDQDSLHFLFFVGLAGISINIVLMILNLLPILPLDGGRILYSFLPPHWALSFGQMEPYGLIILLILLVSGVLQYIMSPPVRWLTNSLIALVI